MSHSSDDGENRPLLENQDGEERVQPPLDNGRIPAEGTEEEKFNFRTLWGFTGPGFLISIAFLDAGNFESDLETGTQTGYKLLWILMYSTLLAMVIQRLAIRLGVVTGRHLAEMCYEQYPKMARLMLWTAAELSVVGANMQEVIGTALITTILSNQKLPFWAGVIFAATDTFMFSLLNRFGLRIFELLFGGFLIVMTSAFSYQYFIEVPSQLDVIKGLAVPGFEGSLTDSVQQTIALMGAIIMPHNLYLHSALVKSRNVERSCKPAVQRANSYFVIDSCISGLVSLLANVFIVCVFARGLHETTNEDVRQLCFDSGLNETDFIDVFQNNTQLVDANLYNSAVFLRCKYGFFAMFVWAAGVRVSSQASAITANFSGQLAMEGFWNSSMSRWKRLLISRPMALLPVLVLALCSDASNMSHLNVYLNVSMSLLLPFSLIPTLTFTNLSPIMGEFVNGWFVKTGMLLLTIFIVVLNVSYVGVSVASLPVGHWSIYVVIGLLTALYLCAVLYLMLHLLASLEVPSCSRFAFWNRTATLRRLFVSDGSADPILSNCRHSVINYGSSDFIQ